MRRPPLRLVTQARDAPRALGGEHRATVLGRIVAWTAACVSGGYVVRDGG